MIKLDEDPLSSTEIDEVSIVIPCRNEEAHIALCLDSVIKALAAVKSYEIIVVDGLSSDSTPEIVAQYAARHTTIKLLQNPERIVPTALNYGIRASRFPTIVRLDAHSEYPPGYIEACIHLMRRTGAQNAGGRCITVRNGTGPWAVAISLVTASRFGVGNGAFRTSDRPGFVDTVPFGVFKRQIFDEVGFFDERLTRNQDNEFNARLISRGYRIAFDPNIRITYKNQAELSGLLRQAFWTGMWNVYTLWLHRYTFRWRRFVPAAFVSYLLALPLALLLTPPSADLLVVAPLVLYLLLDSIISLRLGSSWLERLKLFAVFALYHLTYGSGSIFGVINLFSGRWRRYLGRPLRA